MDKVQPPAAAEDVGVEIRVGPSGALVVGLIRDTHRLAPSQQVVLLDVETETLTASGDTALPAEPERPPVVGLDHDFDSP